MISLPKVGFPVVPEQQTSTPDKDRIDLFGHASILRGSICSGTYLKSKEHWSHGTS